MTDVRRRATLALARWLGRLGLVERPARECRGTPPDETVRRATVTATDAGSGLVVAGPGPHDADHADCHRVEREYYADAFFVAGRLHFAGRESDDEWIATDRPREVRE